MFFFEDVETQKPLNIANLVFVNTVSLLSMIFTNEIHFDDIIKNGFSYLMRTFRCDRIIINRCLSAVLCNANLHGINLYAADLSGANLCETHLGGANLTFANIAEADLAEAGLTGANLTIADLTGVNLTDAFIICSLDNDEIIVKDLESSYFEKYEIIYDETTLGLPTDMYD